MAIGWGGSRMGSGLDSGRTHLWEADHVMQAAPKLCKQVPAQAPPKTLADNRPDDQCRKLLTSNRVLAVDVCAQLHQLQRH